MEQILESFRKSRFLYPILMVQVIFTIKVLCFDQDIVKFISNKISISKDGIFMSYTSEYE